MAQPTEALGPEVGDWTCVASLGDTPAAVAARLYAREDREAQVRAGVQMLLDAGLRPSDAVGAAEKCRKAIRDALLVQAQAMLDTLARQQGLH
jgi:hypothetical protein